MATTRIAVAFFALCLIGTACQSSPVPETLEPPPTAAPTADAVPSPTAVPTVTPVSTAVPVASATPEPTSVSAVELIDKAFAYSRLDETSCPAALADGRISCYLATLPMRVATPDDGDSVELLVARVDNGDPLGSGPVVYLQGGPGIGAVFGAAGWAGASVDAIFFDQRGSGESAPKLDCPQVDALWALELTHDDSRRVDDEVVYEAYETCADRLRSDGVDFDAFHTSAVAADAELLRRLFEVESWTLWGISYGTRVALTVMRDYPQAVRGAVLDSVLPFEVDFFSAIPSNALRSFDALDEACDNSTCVTSRGDVETLLESLVARLDEAPAVVSVTRPVSGETIDVRITGSDLVNLAFQQMYSTRQIRALPRQLAGFDFGGVEEIVRGYVQRRDPEQFDLASALYYTTWCREEFPFHNPTADDTAIAAGTARFGEGFEDALGSDGIDRLCEIFAVLPAPDIDDEPLTSDIPTVVFAGSFDPITPPAWSRAVADSLSNATYVEMPDHGHGMTGPCARSVFYAFVEDPMATLDLACVDATQAPQFD